MRLKRSVSQNHLLIIIESDFIIPRRHMKRKSPQRHGGLAGNTFVCVFSAAALLGAGSAKAGLSAGPVFDDFSLTLETGRAKEAAGPFYGYRKTETLEQWRVSPLFSYSRDPDTESKELDVLYPLFTYDRFGSEYRFQWLQVLSFAGGQDQDSRTADRFTIFPFYFQQRSTDTNLNYTALIPFYGHLKHRLMRDEVRFVLMPLYIQSRKQDVVTDNYLYPFFHLRHGNALSGWQLWPLAGWETKGVTTKTNTIDEIETVGGHRKFMALWPLFFNETGGIGTTNVSKSTLALPFFSIQRSPERDSSTYLWPLITITDDRAKQYKEYDLPWPVIVFARGEGKTANRIWPLFGNAHSTNVYSSFYAWPLYKVAGYRTPAIESERTRILFFLYSDMIQKAVGTNAVTRRTDLWPLFTARREFNGNERLQLFSLIEPFLPNNKSVERNLSPLWSIWRSEKNAKTGASSESFLWNLYRHEKTADSKKCSILFGLFQYQSTPEGRRLRLFYIPMAKRGPAQGNQPKP
jgi:hypothetical protein